jgi:hypothetical protein
MKLKQQFIEIFKVLALLHLGQIVLKVRAGSSQS